MSLDTTYKNEKAVIEREVTSQEEIVLSVTGVSKKFSRNLKRGMLHALQDIGGELFGLRKTNRPLRKSEFWAVQDITFELRRGDAIGLVGSNGAGKTTILKLISGLIKPDRGEIRVSGRVAPLIALGAGFNPVLTGRENVFVNMAILGLTREEIENRFDDVVNFAELKDSIDAPVQTYSSGMSARLGFACAIHTDPDILLIDEVLAVGDMRFRAKCYRKLSALQSSGASFLLVSHSSQSLLTVCKNGLFVSKGRLVDSGPIEKIITQYENSLVDAPTTTSTVKFQPGPNSSGVHIIDIDLINSQQTSTGVVEINELFKVVFSISSETVVQKLKMVIIVRLNSLEADYSVYIDSTRDDFYFDVKEGINRLTVEFPYCAFKAGIYNMKIAISGDNHYMYDIAENYVFTVKNGNNEVNSIFYQKRRWSLEDSI